MYIQVYICMHVWKYVGMCVGGGEACIYTFTSLAEPDKYLPTLDLKKQIVQMEEDFVKVPVLCSKDDVMYAYVCVPNPENLEARS